MPAGAVVEATLFGGLGIDGKNDSPVPFGNTVPLVGNVGEPKKRKKKKIGLENVSRASCV